MGPLGSLCVCQCSSCNVVTGVTDAYYNLCGLLSFWKSAFLSAVLTEGEGSLFFDEIDADPDTTH